MPNCFVLSRKGESAPTSLADVDNELREAFGEPPDDEQWLYGWYDKIGLALALGQNWDQIRTAFNGCERLLKVVDYLEQRFDADSWVER
jgi:hypothetical protein